MVYNYLLNLYSVLEAREKEIAQQKLMVPGDSALEQYRQGQIVALTEFLLFLQKNYEEKLPRRLQKKR